MAITKSFFPVKDTVRAKESDHAQAKDGGGERHLLAGAHTGFIFTSYIKFDPNWTGVQKITKAYLVLVTERGVHEGFPASNSGIKVFRLASDFPDPNNAESEGEFVGRYPVESKDPTHAANGTVDEAEAAVSRIDITGLIGDIAPKSVKRPNGRAGGNRAHHGFAIERRTTNQQSNPRMCVGGMRNSDTTKRPYVELHYEPKKSPNTVSTVAPTGNIDDILTANFEATFNIGANQPRDTKPARWGIELFKQGGTNRLWKYSGAATPSDILSLTCTVPLSLVGTTDSRYKFVSGQGYEWRLRAKDNKGNLTAYSGRRTFGVQTLPPVLSNLRPSPDPALDTLNNVFFRAGYSDPDGNRLLRYQVQVRAQTSPTDPAWADDLLWDSGPVAGSGFAVQTPGQADEIKQPYGGIGLDAGTYSWRMRAWDVLDAQSNWYYSEFVLTKGWEPDPGDVDLLTGYVNRQLKARILIKGFKNDVQMLVITGGPDGGTFKLKYDGLITPAIPWDATAGEVKDALNDLSNIGETEVAVTKDGNKWTVTFDSTNRNRPLLIPVQYHNFAADERVDVYSNRAPGVPVAIIEDAANIGASEMYNSGGEFFFNLPAIHPQVSVIEPYQVHYALEHFRGESWREVAAGYITDFDANDSDVVFYGQDYMAVLGRQIDERFNKKGAADAKAQLWPTAGKGAKYINYTIKQIIADQLDRSIHDIGSPLAFFTRATMPAMNDPINIFVSFKERLPFIAGLIDSHRQGSGRRTRLYAKKISSPKTGASSYQWVVKLEPGRDRPNIRMEYGGLVQGFRVIPFGEFGTRLNAIGKLYNSSRLDYTIARTVAPAGEDKGWYEETYGRFARATTYEDISDRNDLVRRAKQQLQRLTRVGKQLALNLRPSSFAIKDGWDITDSILVDIRRGVVDTGRMGSGYWTVWGWTWELKPDGHELVTLSVLPKEDNSAPEEDLIASDPIHGDAVWQVDDGPPTDSIESDFYFDNEANTIYIRGAPVDDEPGPWEVYSPASPVFDPATCAPGAASGGVLAPISTVSDHYHESHEGPPPGLIVGYTGPLGTDVNTFDVGSSAGTHNDPWTAIPSWATGCAGVGLGVFSEARHTSLWMGYAISAKPADPRAGLRVGVIASAPSFPEKWMAFRVSKNEPDELNEGVMVGVMPVAAGPLSAYIPPNLIAGVGDELWIGLVPVTLAKEGTWDCNPSDWPYATGFGDSWRSTMTWDYLTWESPCVIPSSYAFQNMYVGTGDGVQRTYTGWATQDGTADWYVDGLLTEPLSYDATTGTVSFDRAVPNGARVEQSGTSR